MAAQRSTTGGKWGNRLAIWQASRLPAATGFRSQPEPRSIGLFARGRQLIAGNFLFAGHLIEAPGASIWGIGVPDAAFGAELHGFQWLDDLAAVGDAAARARAQDWTFEWLAYYGNGKGWTPDLTGRRLIRWVNHAFLIMPGRTKPEIDAYFKALTMQTAYLARRWQMAKSGLPRFEALTGLIVAGLALTGQEALVSKGLVALADECRSQIDTDGGISTRNPEELLEVFTLLNWAALALGESATPVPNELTAAITRIAPSLRALRHADGGLARFHGGGRGLEGRLDTALASAGVRGVAVGGPVMGFARLAAGRTTIIVDAAGPPGGDSGVRAHASTLGLELTSGRRPLIVSCGNGAPFGADWNMAGRATVSHSTLSVDGVSSSRFGKEGQALVDRAAVTDLHLMTDGGSHLSARHDGWAATHGLVHARVLALDVTGRRVTGTDMLISDSPVRQRRMKSILARNPDGVGFAVRFHLHPDVDPALDLGGTAVSLGLKSGEIWVFRHDGRAELRIEPSVYLEKGRLQPRATKQIVLSAHASGFETRIGWTLAKAQDTPLAIRDLDRDEASVPI